MNYKEATGQFVVRYTHHLSVGAFLVGFALDNLSLPRIDNPIAHYIIFSYLIMAGVGIMLSALATRGDVHIRPLTVITPFLPPFIQFIFGGLFSSLFVYYFRSASLLGSFPFLSILVVMIIGNELFRSRYDRISFQVDVFFTTLFGFMIFYLPLAFLRLDTTMFLASGAVSLFVTVLFVAGLFIVAPITMREVWQRIVIAIVAIFFCLNLLYATKSIPPVPLVLISGGIYHDITKNEDGTYTGKEEVRTWYERHIALTPPEHVVPGESLYFGGAVFAPSAFAVPIYHEWQHRDESSNEWVTSTRVPFSIYGGRDGGYRGYSTKNALTAGEWRVLVKTANGQLLGQRAFTIIPQDTPVPLEEKAL
jgi:hypothetical protein